MKNWILSRLNEKSTWLGVIGFIGTIAALPILDVRTVVINACAALTGILAGANTGETEK